MPATHRLPQFLAVLCLASFVSGCGGCQGTPTEAPPKAVQGNAPQKPAAAAQQEQAPPAGEAKDACGVLVFTNVDGGPAPLNAQLTAEGDCTSGTAKVQWDFGDGAPAATGETVVHTFEKPGTYTVKGTITTDAVPGLEDSDTVDVVVTAPKG